jgi:hypothetical protein
MSLSMIQRSISFKFRALPLASVPASIHLISQQVNLGFMILRTALLYIMPVRAQIA